MFSRVAMHPHTGICGTGAACACLFLLLFAATGATAQKDGGGPEVLSTGQRITPLLPGGSRFEPLNPHLADNPDYTVGQAETTVTSPDGKTLLVLTSGYNRINFALGPNAGQQNKTDSTEFVFVFDISGKIPIQKQAIAVPNTYSGIAFHPDGREFYVSGGDDDNVHVFRLESDLWRESETPIKLGHLARANPEKDNRGGLGLDVKPEAAGIAITSDGKKLVVVNYENDSISILNAGEHGWTLGSELDLRVGGEVLGSAKGGAGGEYPFWVAIKGNDTAYLSSIRDRQLVVVSLSGPPRVTKRIKLPGQPSKIVMNKAQSRLYVAQDNSDSVAVIDTSADTIVDEIQITAPAAIYPNKKNYKGANPNSLTLSPDEKTLYVTNGGENAVAVVRLSGIAGKGFVAGLIPTGFYPNSVSTSADGKSLYIVNGKSGNGPNPLNCAGNATALPHGDCKAANQYALQLTKAGFQTLSVPGSSELGRLTEQVIENDSFRRLLTPEEKQTLAFLHARIRHVIYIIKENRTYDQVLGDLEVGNGDPRLAQFPERFTPNFHSMARSFNTLDNFYDTSNVSYDGWAWSTGARTTDMVEKQYTVNCGGRGLSYDSEGTNRNINIGYGNLQERLKANPLTPNDPDLLPGQRDAAAPDGPDGEESAGHLWDAALRAHLTVRNYGFFIDLARYQLKPEFASSQIPLLKDPESSHTIVAYATSPVLKKHTDPYFRGFDNSLPDFYRFKEWEREFDENSKAGRMPSLTLLRLMHDHFGNFMTAIDGVNTPELQIADNDYAVGLVVEKIAHSRFKNSTLIFVIEDDSQNGPDHVDAHRSTAFVVGPYVKHKYVDSTRYNTVSMIRTMEEILGTEHLNLNDASALPMVDLFDPKQGTWDYKASASAALKPTKLPIEADRFDAATASNTHPRHGPAWWAAHTQGMDFSVEDHLDSTTFNAVLWDGTMTGSYPYARSGEDMRPDRERLLQGSSK